MPGPKRTRAGFTLIEMLAVVAIFALLAALLVPAIGTLGNRDLDQAADRMAGLIELARQRSVATGTPHRLRIDLDNAAWRLEWLVSEAQALGEEPLPEEPLDLRRPISLAPSRSGDRDFFPLPGLFGRADFLKTGLSVSTVETAEGIVAEGEVFVPFETDGTAPYTVVTLEGDDGRGLALEVLPLTDAVRIFDVAI